MASKIVYFSCLRTRDPLTGSEIKEYFDRTNEKIDSIQLYAKSMHCYGIIRFRHSKNSEQFFQESHRIRGISLHFCEQPNRYHRVFESFEEANCATLLWLNDDCLQKVFSYLDIEDLCSATDVCQRFKSNAQTQFAHQHQHVIISWDREEQLSNRQMRYFGRILRNFGAYIKSLDVMYPSDGKRSMELMIRYCGSELRKLHLVRVYIEDESLLESLRPLFSRLHELSITNCRRSFFLMLSSCFELQVLELSCLDIRNEDGNVVHSIFNRNYPKLTKATLLVDNIENEIHFLNFVEMNPQLKSLEISMLNETILQTIAQSIPSLEALGLYFDTYEIMLANADDLNRLTALRVLTLDGSCTEELDSDVVSTILDSIANLQIKCLEFIDVFLEDDHIEKLCKLKSIEKLVLNIHGELRTWSTELPDICKHLPILEELIVANCDDGVTADEIVQLIECAGKLKCLRLDKTAIDVDAFDGILHIVSQREERIPLKITLWESTDKLPNAVLDAHKDVLRIAYEGFERKWSECPLQHYRRP